MLKVHATAKEAYKGTMVHLTKDSDLIEDLVSTFGVTKLGAFDSNSSAILKKAFVNLAIPSGTK